MLKTTATKTDTPKQRPLFQLHLSTCVVLMLVTGGLLGLNLYQRGPYALTITTSQALPAEYEVAMFCGWPLPFWPVGSPCKTNKPAPWPMFSANYSAGCDLIIVVVACVVTAILLEKNIRCRDRHCHTGWRTGR